MTEIELGPAEGPWDGERLWELVSARGMDRRQFLQLLLAGGAAAGWPRRPYLTA